MVLLDERGREVTSEGLAQMVAKAGDDGAPLAFCIGGPFGHGPAVRARADDSIRLSRLVLNHQVGGVGGVERGGGAGGGGKTMVPSAQSR